MFKGHDSPLGAGLNPHPGEIILKTHSLRFLRHSTITHEKRDHHLPPR
jgi:hypothetical protein